MNANYITNIINDFDYGVLSISLFISGAILLLFYFVRKSGYFGISQILSTKRQKEVVLAGLIESLNNIKILNGKLIKQKEVIESYDTDTAANALSFVQKELNNSSKLICLNNEKLMNDAIFFLSGQNKMLVELTNIEQESYQFQVEYQQRVLFYNREYDKLKSNHADSDQLVDYKRSILSELEKIRINVTTALDNLNIKRNEFYKELTYSQTLLDTLLTDLNNYTIKEVKSKRFYLRYLSFL